MQGTQEHVKDEITEDAATMKKGTRCYNTGTMNKSS